MEESALKESEPELSQKAPASPRESVVKAEGIPKPLHKLNENLAAITSVVLRSSLLILLVTLAIFLYREVTNKSYNIQEVRLPQRLIDQGHNGETLAMRLQGSILNYVHTAHLTWSQNEIDLYNQTSRQANVQVEVGGIGFSPQSIVRYLKDLLGIPPKDIACDVIVVGNELQLTIAIDGWFDHVRVPLENSDHEALMKLIRSGAVQILERTNPVIAGILYATGGYSPEGVTQNDSIAIKIFRKVIGERSEHAATAYAWWARVEWLGNQDSIAAFDKIQKALRIDSQNAFAYRTLSAIKFNNGQKDEAERLMKKSLALDPTSGSGWAALANRYVTQGRREDALECMRKAAELDPSNFYGFEVAEILITMEQYREALDVIENEENSGMWTSRIDGMRVVCLVGLGDSIRVRSMIKNLDKVGRRDMANSLNNFAFTLERNGKYDQGLEVLELALEADSTLAISYTTLAEIHGLMAHDGLFYLHLEKALKYGYPAADIANTQDEPYKTYSKEARFSDLIKRYSK